MASLRDVVLGQLGTSEYLLKKMTADLSDAEFFVPPVAGGNHAAWIVGHIAVSEDSMAATATGGPRQFDKERELFRGGQPCHADATKYPARAALDQLLWTVRANTVAALRKFDEARWDEPAPPGPMKEMFPTLGAMWGLIGTHPFWHIGQLTMCRRALGKTGVLG